MKQARLIMILRRILNRMPHNEDGSLIGYKGKGEWEFLWTSLTLKPDELAVLFAAAGFDLERKAPVAPAAPVKKSKKATKSKEVSDA